jgi:uncharacterized protein YndB with AHSA1/START domain
MMKLISSCAAMGLAISAMPAAAEVKSISPTHFEVERKITTKASPEAAYQMLGQVSSWWNPDHSYSGNASNLRLELKAGGCLCETIPQGDGSVEHLRIVFARPGLLLRAQGGLGPLQGEAVSGTLTWSFKPVAGGTEVTQTYLVSGHIRGGTATMAPAVDAMLAEQLSRLEKRLVS